MRRLSPLDRVLESAYSPKITSFERELAPPKRGIGTIYKTPSKINSVSIPFRLVAGVSQRILADNPYRKLLIIQNLDTVAQMIVNFGQDADAINGITLQPLGSAFFDYSIPDAAVFVFSASAISGFIQQQTSMPE